MLTALRRSAATVAVFLCLAPSTLATSASAATSFPLKAPAGLVISDAVATSAYASWSSVPKAPRYRLQIATSKTMAGAVYQRTVGGETRLLMPDLRPSTTYYVKVRAITSSGDKNLSLYSGAVAFKTHAPYPTPSSLRVTQLAATSGLTTWSSVPNAPRYRLQISTDKTMAGAVYHRTDGKATKLVVPGLLPLTTYYAKVRTITDAGQGLSDYSPAITFKTPAKVPHVTKLLIVVEENSSLDQMKSGMPYAYSLAQKYGYASNFPALRHPSRPNYIGLAAGDMLGVTDNKLPKDSKLNATTIFGQAIAGGKTAKTYADGMPSNCFLSNGGTKYVPRHNPWVYFTNERALCQKYDVPFAKNFVADAANGTLPNVGLVIPNNCNNAHDCSLKVADAWFRDQVMAKVFNGPDWKSGRLAVVLTADEDNKKQGNRVLTSVIHPSQVGKVVTTSLTTYSLSRLVAEVTQTPALRNAVKAPSMSSAFGLPLEPMSDALSRARIPTG